MAVSADFEQATIAAIATPPGAGGIGIIRISGSQAPAVLARLFRPAGPSGGRPESSLDQQLQTGKPPSHRLRYGWIVNPADGRLVDEVMAVYMAAPATYTREEVVEIHGHGGYVVLREILELVLALPEVRAAEPGEFTKRAFLNGRIDLTRAEAVIELLNAQTRQGAELALSQLAGGLQQRVGVIREALLALLAVVEVAIDFPDEDGEIVEADRLQGRLAEEARRPLEALLAGRRQGRIYREGAAVVILGRPNVGKSSLLNALLREERAIVTPVAGTTRDTIEEFLDIHGVPVRIVDTAGIRQTSETVEDLGISRSRSRGAAADLVLLLLDATAGVTPEDLELFRSVAAKNLLVVVNKLDLLDSAWPPVGAGKVDEGGRDGGACDWGRSFPGRPLVGISARTGQGLEQLEQAIFSALTGGSSPQQEDGAGGRLSEPDHLCVPNARHEAALVKALAAVKRIEAGLEAGQAPELLAVELQGALAYLGEIVGENGGDDLLDAIFSRFCIGK